MTSYSDKTPENTPRVEVHWNDVATEDNWDEDCGVFDVYDAVIVGWLLEDSDKQVIIASSYNQDDQQWGTLHAIPKLPPQIIPVSENDAAMLPNAEEVDDA